MLPPLSNPRSAPRETEHPPMASSRTPAAPYREDCWSDGSTSALIDAWGVRFTELSRGNLRHTDWQDVADAVNSRPAAARRPPRSHSQCKNRIDTLKKKYKLERSKITDAAASGLAADSPWPFFPRLHSLLAGSSPSPAAPRGHSPPPAPWKRSLPPTPAQDLTSLPADPSFRRNYSAAAAAAAAAAAESSGSSSRESSPPRQRLRMVNCDTDGEDGVRELARAIDRFAEVYERVEREKQRQGMELERQRMEFAKRLEFQRMEMFVDSQVQLERIRRGKRVEEDGEGGSASSAAALSLLSMPAAFGL